MSASSLSRVQARLRTYSARSQQTVPKPAGPDPAGNVVGMLESCFSTEGPRLLRYFRRKAGADDAPDLVQEVFARAAGSPQSAQVTNPPAFLARIARNLLIDRARRARTRAVREVPIEDAHNLACPPQQEWGIAERDLRQVYQQAVATLPAKTRDIFLMHRIDALTYREIHDRLGISIATVEYHMMKALRHIAREVDAAP